MNILAEIKSLRERVEILETQKQKEIPDASINSVDNKDLPNGSDTKASPSTTRGLPSKKLKKQTGRQAVGKSKTTSGKKVNAKKGSKTN